MSFFQDLRFAARTLARRPSLTVTAALTLALGIGINTSMFSLLEALVLRPLPYPQSEQLVVVWQTMLGNDRRWVAPANFLDWREQSGSFSEVAAFYVSERNLAGAKRPTRVRAADVSRGFFDLLGVTAASGRAFAGGDEATGPQAVVAESFWKRELGADPGILGSELRLDGTAYEVVGVMRAGFTFPEQAVIWTLAPNDVPGPSLPMGVDPRTVRDSRYLKVVARIAPHVSLASARTEMHAIARRLEAAFPEANADTGINVVPLHDELVGSTGQTLKLLLAAVFLILAIAVANVANLMLAEAARRRRSLAVRHALGASGWRLARASLVEALLLAVLGGGVGLLLSAWATPLLAALLPLQEAPLPETGLPAMVLAFSLAVVLGTALSLGLLPALDTARPRFLDALRGSARGAGSRAVHNRWRAGVVVLELALATVLVSSAGLLVRTLANIDASPRGFAETDSLTARVSLPDAGSRPAHERRSFYARVVERLDDLPGVQNAAASLALPFQGPSPSANIRVEGQTFPPGAAPDVSWRVVTPTYFDALGIPLLRGRWFGDADRAGAPAVAVVNATLARSLWPDADAIGQRIGTGLDSETGFAEVVGVVGDTPQESVRHPIRPEMYRPLAQESRFGGRSMFVVVRREGDRVSADELRLAVWQIDPEAPITQIASLADIGRDASARERSTGLLLAIFSVLALMLGAIGIHGVIAGLVAERTQEIGVRMALGADMTRIVRGVVAHGLRLAAAGAALGLIASVWTVRLLSGLLYGVAPLDPVTLLSVAVALIAVAVLATAWPAMRAARVDPATALRAE